MNKRKKLTISIEEPTEQQMITEQLISEECLQMPFIREQSRDYSLNIVDGPNNEMDLSYHWYINII